VEFVYPEIQPEVNISPARLEIEPRRLMGMAFSKIRQALDLLERIPPQQRGGSVSDLIDVLEKYGTANPKRKF
jgi:hypothetical protein